MRKVFQTIVDPGNGNCMQAAIASLFDKELTEVPHFVESGEKWFQTFWDFLKANNADYAGVKHNKNYSTLMDPTYQCFKPLKFHRAGVMTRKCLYKEPGINGYFYASVLSVKYFTWGKQVTHAVIIDRDFNIVHDPSPNNKDILTYPLANILGFNGVIDVYLIEPKK